MTKEKVSKPRVRNDYKAKYAFRICKVSDNRSSRLSSRVFKSVISGSIRDLIQSNTTSDKIWEKLSRRYPAHKKKLTHDMVRSHIKLESGVTVHHITMKASGQEIENEQSVFIDDEADNDNKGRSSRRSRHVRGFMERIKKIVLML